MKAAYIQNPGPADTIIYGDLPDPSPAPNQLLIEVKAVSVNPIDTYIPVSYTHLRAHET